MFLKECLEQVGNTLPTLVILKRLELPTSVSLCISFKSLERIKDHRLLAEEVNRKPPSLVINECHPIAISLTGLDRKWTVKIRVD